MILYPLQDHTNPSSAVRNAWDAILESQRQPAEAWGLIAQPDHAALAGELAAVFQPPQGFPQIDDEVLRAVRLHDAGWAALDGGEPAGTGRPPSEYPPPQSEDARPLSFADSAPSEVPAIWTDSINAAASAGPVAGFMVSLHFCVIGQNYLQRINDPLDRGHLLDFIQRESARQSQLAASQRRSMEQLEKLTALLQFCDLASLYLCCGRRDPIEFPQKFDEQPVRARWEGNTCHFEPAPFRKSLKLNVPARKWPGTGEITRLEFLVS